MYILFFSFFLSFFLFFFFFFCEIYGCYGCYKFGDQLPSRICFSYNFIQVKSSLLFTSCGTALKLASMHCSLTSISFQLYVILTGNIIQIYNFGCCGYYLEETTDRKYVDAYWRNSQLLLWRKTFWALFGCCIDFPWQYNVKNFDKFCFWFPSYIFWSLRFLTHTYIICLIISLRMPVCSFYYIFGLSGNNLEIKDSI